MLIPISIVTACFLIVNLLKMYDNGKMKKFAGKMHHSKMSYVVSGIPNTILFVDANNEYTRPDCFDP